jgi:plasmid maintenance system antidote protein VapI
MAKSLAHLTDKQNARLRTIIKDELLARVPKQLHLARLLGVPQGNLSRFLDGRMGAGAPVAFRVAFLLDRSVEEVLGLAPSPELVDEQERRYPSRILAARTAYLEGVPLPQIRAVLNTSLHYDGDPGAHWWLKMMQEGHLAKPGNKRDTAWALKQVQPPGWDKGPARRRVERPKRR